MEGKFINVTIAILALVLCYLIFSHASPRMFVYPDFKTNTNTGAAVENRVDNSKVYRIAFINADSNSQLFAQLQSEFEWAYEEHKKKYTNENISVDFFESAGDVQSQINTVLKVYESGYDVTVIIPCSNNPQLVDTIRTLAVTKKQKFVILNRSIDLRLDDSIYNVIPDNYMAGALQAEHIAKVASANYKIYYLRGDRNTTESSDRLSGFEETLKKVRPDARIIGVGEAPNGPDNARAVADSWLSSGIKTNCIVCENDMIALGVLEVLRERGQLGSLPILSVDGITEIIDEVRRGNVAMVSHQFIYFESLTAFNICHELYLGNKVIYNHKPVFISVTKDSVITYIDREKI